MLGMFNTDRTHRGHDGLAACCHGDRLVIYMKQVRDTTLEDYVVDTLLTRQRFGSVVFPLFSFFLCCGYGATRKKTQGYLDITLCIRCSCQGRGKRRMYMELMRLCKWTIFFADSSVAAPLL